MIEETPITEISILDIENKIDDINTEFNICLSHDAARTDTISNFATHFEILHPEHEITQFHKDLAFKNLNIDNYADFEEYLLKFI